MHNSFLSAKVIINWHLKYEIQLQKAEKATLKWVPIYCFELEHQITYSNVYLYSEFDKYILLHY